MMRSLSAAKATLDLVPCEVNYRRASVDVVCRQGGVPERCEERAHLRLRQLFTCFDSRFASDRSGETLMLGRRPGDSVTGEGVECLPQAPLGVEPRMRHRYRVHDQGVSTEAFNLETQSLEVFAVGVERLPLRRAEMKSEWKQEPLRRCRSTFEVMHELLVQHPLVGRVLIDEDQPLLVLKRDVGPPELKQRRNYLRR